MAKEGGTFAFHPHKSSPPTTCFPTVAAQGRRGSRAGRGHFPATAGSGATEGGRGESPPPAHLPGLRTLRLRWRAGLHCPRPRKPPAPPAAAEASQRLEWQPPPLLPPPSLRCSRAAPARRPLALGRYQLLAEEGGATQLQPQVCGSEAELQKTLDSQVLFFLIVTAKWRGRRMQTGKVWTKMDRPAAAPPCGW